MGHIDLYRRQPWERPADPPQDWIELPAPGGFNFTFGPVFARRDGDGIAIGFRCTERHLNPSGFCHGAALSAFADMQAYGIQHMVGYARALVPTVTMTLDFLSVVRPGDWVEGALAIARRSGSLVFSDMRCRVDDRPVLNARAIFKLMEMGDLADPSYFTAIGPEIDRRFAGAGT